MGFRQTRLASRFSPSFIYRPGEPRSIVATGETLDSYEYALLSALAARPSDRPGVVTDIRNREYAPKLELLPIPKEIEEPALEFLQRRHQQLMTAYRVLLGEP